MSKLDYESPRSRERNPWPFLRWFWGLYAIGAALSNVPGAIAWTLLFGRGPDRGGAILLWFGILVTTAIALTIYSFVAKRLTFVPFPGAAVGFLLGLCSPLSGILIAILFF